MLGDADEGNAAMHFICFERLLFTACAQLSATANKVRRLKNSNAVTDDGNKHKRAGHYHTTSAQSVNKKAIQHVWNNICDVNTERKPVSGGGLNETCGYLLVSDAADGDKAENEKNEPFLVGMRGTLILYDTTSYPGLDYKSLRPGIVTIMTKK